MERQKLGEERKKKGAFSKMKNELVTHCTPENDKEKETRRITN